VIERSGEEFCHSGKILWGVKVVVVFVGGKMIEGLTSAQTRALTRINVGASALSFAGTSFIVMCYILFKDLRTFPFKLIFYLSLSVSCELRIP
jgi:hypothetical protein